MSSAVSAASNPRQIAKRKGRSLALVGAGLLALGVACGFLHIADDAAWVLCFWSSMIFLCLGAIVYVAGGRPWSMWLAGKDSKQRAVRRKYALSVRSYYFRSKLLSRFNGEPVQRWHFFLPSVLLGLVALAGGMNGEWSKVALFGLPALVLFGYGAEDHFYSPRAAQRLREEKQERDEEFSDYGEKVDKVAERSNARAAAARRRPPVWPPRKPDDWGVEIQERHQAAVELSRSLNIGKDHALPDPVMPIIPSWEEHQRRLESKDMRQVRWARNENGEWVKLEWGNSAKRPANGLLPVYQSMRNEATGEWTWVKIGEGAISLDWQNGPAKFEKIAGTTDGKPVTFLRPVGTAGVTPTPLPIEPGGEHGDSREQSVDDLVKAGIVAPR